MLCCFVSWRVGGHDVVVFCRGCVPMCFVSCGIVSCCFVVALCGSVLLRVVHCIALCSPCVVFATVHCVVSMCVVVLI